MPHNIKCNLLCYQTIKFLTPKNTKAITKQSHPRSVQTVTVTVTRNWSLAVP